MINMHWSRWNSFIFITLAILIKKNNRYQNITENKENRVIRINTGQWDSIVLTGMAAGMFDI